MHFPWTHQILQKIYQELCQDGQTTNTLNSPVLYKVLSVYINWQLVLTLRSLLPEFPFAIVKELCNIQDISILMNMLVFNPKFRAMSNKVMTS